MSGDATNRRTYTVAVYFHPEERRESRRWTCAIKWWMPHWEGFVGTFDVEASGATEAHKKAIELAKATNGGRRG